MKQYLEAQIIQLMNECTIPEIVERILVEVRNRHNTTKEDMDTFIKLAEKFESQEIIENGS